MKPNKTEKHLVSVKEQDLSNRPEKSKDAFSKFFDRMLKKRNKATGLATTKQDIADMLGISHEMFRKYVNGEKKIKKRDCVIAICAMLLADTTDTNNALYLLDMGDLYDYDPRDAILMEILDENAFQNQSISIDEINNVLTNNPQKQFFPKLDIINHRQKKIENTNTYPFTVVKKRVECWTDELIFGVPYDSLETDYSRLCRVCAYMWLDDNGRRGFKLCADSKGYLSCSDDPTIGNWYHEYNSPDDSGIFKNCFKELQQMIYVEKRKMTEYLNDTRNYIERISAKVINNELHVFHETYNYSVPELGEYYLMDYVNDEYTLYVSHRSRFMRFYLSENDYYELFGIIPDKTDETYKSLEQIEKTGVVRLRAKAFCKAQEKINTLINDLKLGNAHIRNIKMIFDNKYDVLSYYNVKEIFQCRCNAEYGEIEGVGIDRTIFSLGDGRKVELSVDDLIAGFNLGLSTVEEIGVFLLKHKTLEIADLLDSGLSSPKNN